MGRGVYKRLVTPNFLQFPYLLAWQGDFPAEAGAKLSTPIKQRGGELPKIIIILKTQTGCLYQHRHMEYEGFYLSTSS